MIQHRIKYGNWDQVKPDRISCERCGEIFKERVNNGCPTCGTKYYFPDQPFDESENGYILYAKDGSLVVESIQEFIQSWRAKHVRRR